MVHDATVNSTSIIIVISLIIVLAVVVLIVRKRSRGGKIKTFWDVVRNPKSIRSVGEFHKRIADNASSISGSKEKVAGLVDYYVFETNSSRDGWAEIRTIAELGEEAYPRALEILRDPSMHERLTSLGEGEFSLPTAPICRLAKIFDQDAPPPPEAAELLAPFIENESREIRKSVVLVIGSTGSAESLPSLQQAAKDEDDYVRSYMLMGIQRAVTGCRISDPDKPKFFELVAGMWPEDTSFNVSTHLPTILIKLDRDRAVERLLMPDLFTIQFEPVWRILEAFGSESVMAPRDKLLQLVEKASEDIEEHPNKNTLESALFLLGKHRMEEDLPLLERMVDHTDKDVSRGAVKGLYSYHRYFDLIRNPWDVEEAKGWDALTEAEKHICAIEVLKGEVDNGGFAQYYFNSSGELWQDAFNGLAAIGADKRHGIMKATLERFEQSEPAVDRETRNSQLSKIVSKQEDPFKEQDSAWYKAEDEPLDRLMFRYNLANMQGREKA